MTEGLGTFGGIAVSLARNPLGIIALFLVLVYGFAALVTAFAGSMTEPEKLPLVYFLVIFPVLVLAVFTWLVARHSNKLFAPSDFKDENNYVKMQLSAVASLAAAATKGDQSRSENEIQEIVDMVQATPLVRNFNHQGQQINWRNRILWVDDNPDNNIYERRAFEAVGLKLVLATSTAEALNIIQANLCCHNFRHGSTRRA
jgi:hypothetical protein